MLKTILSVIFVLICLALTVIVLLQEGKSQGLGAIGGMAETYWGVAFMVLAIVLNLV